MNNHEIPEILPAKYDFVFKQLFGDERNKDILAGFLNAVTKIPLEQLKTLEIINSELTPETTEGKKGVLDVYVKLADGKRVDIEIQVAPLTVMPERSLYYWARMYVDQLPKGSEYQRLQKCIAINVVDFKCVDLDEIHTVFTLKEDRYPEYVLTDKLEIHFLELPSLENEKATEKADEAIINWLTLISTQSREVLEVIAKKNETFSKAADILEAISRDKKNRALYEAEQKMVRDEKSRILDAKLKGLEEGIQKGKQEGKQEGIQIGEQRGIQIGEQRGIQIGEQRGMRLLVRNMKSKNMDVNTIHELTDLPIEEIQNYLLDS